MTTKCPSQELLRRYTLGDYDDLEGDRIEQHLESCPACEETLASFDASSDTLVRHLPLAVRQGQGVEPAWLKRLATETPVPNDGSSLGVQTSMGIQEAAAPAISGLESYELQGVLGKGGMGVVYLARHRQLDRTVAIKVMHPRLMSAGPARDRFEREIRILGALKHPGIVMATDAGKVGDAAYLVMEFIDGIDLARLVRHAGPVSVGDACLIAMQIASALSAAHLAGAVHRDVKPSNVMLDRSGRTKLLDFGLAQFSPALSVTEETSVGWMLGTLDYMSPEQSEGTRTSEQSDLYSLGATLFFLLTARPPHRSGDEKTLLDQLRSIAHQTIPRLDAVRGDVPKELADYVSTLLASDPDDRPESAEHVRSFLHQFVSERERISDTLCGCIGAELKEMEKSKKDFQAVVASLHELLGPRCATSLTRPLSLAAVTAKLIHRPPTKWLIAGATGGLAVLLAGIVFFIQTRSGTLRIESEVADVRIELVDEDQAIKQLEITGGHQETKINAGRYRIRLATGYDQFALDADTVTISSGEDQVVKITRLDNVSNPLAESFATRAQGMDDVNDQVGATLSDVDYKTRQEWIDVFENSADPLQKLNAAREVVETMRRERSVGISPEPGDLMLPIQLGGTLVRDGWGDSLTEFVLDTMETIDDRLEQRFEPVNWPNERAVQIAWNDFVTAVDSFLDKRDRQDVFAHLAHVINQGTDHDAAFAMVYILESSIPPQQISGLYRLLLEGINPDSSRWGLVTLYLANVIENSDLQELRPAYVLLAEQLDRPIVSEADRKKVDAWLRSAEGVLRNATGAAPLLLRSIVDDPTKAQLYFHFQWMRDSRPYYSQYQYKRMESTEWFLGGWPQAVNAYWASKPFDNVTEVDRVLFQTLRYYAMTGSSFEDQSSIDRTGELLIRWLERYYGPVDAPPIDEGWETLLPGRPDEMLATLVNLGQELPDQMIHGMPRSQSARELLHRYRKLISSTDQVDRLAENAKSVVGTLAVAPLQTVRSLLLTQTASNRLGHPQMLQIAAPDRANGPPLDPILLMMISQSTMAAEDGGTAMLAFHNLMFGDSPKIMYQHFKDAIECQMKQKLIVINRLAEIAMVQDGPMLTQLRSFDDLVNKAIIQRQSNPGGGGFM